jgi:hemolysin III
MMIAPHDATGPPLAGASVDPSAATALRRPYLRGVSHLAAVPFALAGAVFLALQAGEPLATRLTVLVFGVSVVGLYATSSLYHVPTWGKKARFVLSRIDHAMIQLTIAATFTPIAYHALPGRWRTWSLIVAWTIALAGAAATSLPYRTPRWARVAGYVAAGWLIVVPLSKAMVVLPWQGNGLIILGGVLYTVGAVVYARGRPNPFPRWFGYHEIFHLLVVAASTAHYLAIWRYVLPS